MRRIGVLSAPVRLASLNYDDKTRLADISSHIGPAQLLQLLLECLKACIVPDRPPRLQSLTAVIWHIFPFEAARDGKRALAATYALTIAMPRAIPSSTPKADQGAMAKLMTRNCPRGTFGSSWNPVLGFIFLTRRG